MAVMHGQCQCGNSDPSKFWLLTSENMEETFGICCKKRSCHHEYLIGRFIDDNQQHLDVDITFNDIPLHLKGRTTLEYDTDYQAALDRSSLTGDLTSLCSGDHVAFPRPTGIWHHAIVKRVRNNTEIDVIHWAKRNNSTIIHEQTLLAEDFRNSCKINYSEEQIQQNHPDLVLARAMSRLANTETQSQYARPFVFGNYNENYGFLNQNCEDFAMYCKLGCISISNSSLIGSITLGRSRQLEYLMSQLRNALQCLFHRSVRVFPHIVKALLSKVGMLLTAEVIENLIQFLTEYSCKLELIGFSAVVIMEVGSLIKHYNRLQGTTSESYEFRKKCLECVLTIVLYGGVGVLMFMSGFPLLVEILINIVLVLLCKTLLPQSLSNFIDWFFDEDSGLLSRLHYLSRILPYSGA